MKLAFVVVALLVVQAVTGESFEEWKVIWSFFNTQRILKPLSLF